MKRQRPVIWFLLCTSVCALAQGKTSAGENITEPFELNSAGFNGGKISGIAVPDVAAPAPSPRTDAEPLNVLPDEEVSKYLADGIEPSDDTSEMTDPGKLAADDVRGDGKIALYNVYSHESLEVVYREADGGYNLEAFGKIRHFMRCRLTQKEIDTPPELVELLDKIQDHFGGRPVRVDSGYRSPKLNSHISGSAKHSLHMKGWAADIEIPGVSTKALKTYALSLHAGGVGYYPRDGFVHVDIGAVRYWEQ